ncbi:cyclic nucleotide-gated ion channel 1-like [Rosa sericea]
MASSHTMDMPPRPTDNTEDTTDAMSKTDPEAKEGKWQKQKRNMIFAGSCLLAVLLDPLFLYIPILNDDMKCIGVDKNLKIVALVLRSFTDLIHIVKIIFQISQPEKSPEIWESYMKLVKGGAPKRSDLAAKKTMVPRLLLLVDILAVLPIPQVVIILMRGSELNAIIMNSLLVFQYVPRVFCVYLACKECKISLEGNWELWLKGGLCFSMYILASNVFGAFWYFFSIQRMIDCWQSACCTQSDHNKCKFSAFECHGQPFVRNMTLTFDLCPINPQNATLFDFGIFLNVLQPGIAGSTNFAQKLTNCLLWALRNLSSFGSNLQPSINTMKTFLQRLFPSLACSCFYISLGNYSIYMGWETTMKQQDRWTKEVDRWMKEVQVKNQVKKLIKLLEPKIDSWLKEYGLDPSLFKSKVEAEVINLALKSNKDDVDKDKIFPNLSRGLRNEIMDSEYIGLARLKKVQLLRNIDEEGLKRISERLKPQKYTKSKTIIKEKESLKMIFIVDGVASIEKSYCPTRWELKAGEFYGEQLLQSPSAKATESIRAKTDVQALILEAETMQSLISENKLHINEEITDSSKYDINLLSMLKNVLSRCLGKKG